MKKSDSLLLVIIAVAVTTAVLIFPGLSDGGKHIDYVGISIQLVSVIVAFSLLWRLVSGYLEYRAVGEYE